MFKRIICVFLIFIITSSVFTRLFYFAGYELNKDYIAQNLCINKNKPELHCNGKCFLGKKIAEAEQKQSSQEKKVQKDLTEQIMLIATFNIVFHQQIAFKEKENYKNNYSFTNSSSAFHPPPFSV